MAGGGKIETAVSWIKEGISVTPLFLFTSGDVGNEIAWNKHQN